MSRATQVVLLVGSGSSQREYIIGVANKTFLEQSPVCDLDSGKLARVARSSNSAELQAAADAEEELRQELLRSQVHWCWILVEYNQRVWV